MVSNADEMGKNHIWLLIMTVWTVAWRNAFQSCRPCFLCGLLNRSDSFRVTYWCSIGYKTMVFGLRKRRFRRPKCRISRCENMVIAKPNAAYYFINISSLHSHVIFFVYICRRLHGITYYLSGNQWQPNGCLSQRFWLRHWCFSTSCWRQKRRLSDWSG